MDIKNNLIFLELTLSWDGSTPGEVDFVGHDDDGFCSKEVQFLKPPDFRLHPEERISVHDWVDEEETVGGIVGGVDLKKNGD